MLLCPECHQALPGDRPSDCKQCNWTLETVEGISVLLSSSDRASPTFRDYAENYDRIAADDLSESIQGPAYLALQAETLFSYLPKLEGRRVCEVGLGQGMLFDKLLAARPARLIGLDISRAYLDRFAELHSPAVSVAVANAENLPFADEFDLVIASEILEHVLNVGDFLISLYRSLTDGGRVFVRVPYREDLRAYARESGCPYRFVHLRSFTRDNLLDVMHRAGFKARRVRYDGHTGWTRRRLTHAAGPVGSTLLRPLLDDTVPKRGVSRYLLGLLLRPITLTAEFEKV